MAKVGSRCLHYFPAAILMYHGCTPTWRFHTGLCKFLRNISTNISSLGKHTGLKLGEVSHLVIFYNMTISYLFLLDGIDLSPFFYFVTPPCHKLRIATVSCDVIKFLKSKVKSKF